MGGKKESRHHAYLLRCWREEETPSCPSPHWRFSVENVLEHRSRRGFDGLDALVAFLQAEFVGEREELSARAWPGDSKKEKVTDDTKKE